jgi:S-DNA-T family DNA segregation ATPase FtsK/SpoIIIE
VPLGFAVVMWGVSSSPAMMLFALMGPVAMVASLADARRQSRAAQRTATEDATNAQNENERQRAHEDEREAARARRQHPSLADLLEHGHHRPVAPGIAASTSAPSLIRLGLDPGRRPVLIPLDADVCVLGSPQATQRVASAVALTRAWIGRGAEAGSVSEATNRAAIPVNTSLLLTLGERGWAELTDVRTPLDAVAVLVDEVSEAHATRARRELETSRALRHESPPLSELRDTLARFASPGQDAGDDEHDSTLEPSHVRGILGWSDALTGPAAVWTELSDEVPHMLIAGATGSGKTETLVALLASMAAAHPPECFRFAVIDFKGGGGFVRVASFAHNAGITTDLDGDDVLRALAGIRAEMARRETILRDAGRTDISALPSELRVPRLLIVIDEFRALCDAVPDARRIVADVASRGRALGVHLVVATQRAAGAFGDDLLVNAQTRLCLAPVADDDARYLLGAVVSPAPAGVVAVTRLLHVRRPSGQVVTVHPVCVDADTLDAASRWTANAEPDNWRLWWPELPHELSAAAVRDAAHSEGADEGADEGKILLGLRQDSRTSRWSVLDYEPGRDGALWVFGGPRSGKTTLLQNIRNEVVQHADVCNPGVSHPAASHPGGPAGGGESRFRTVVMVPGNAALAWDVIITTARASEHRPTHHPELVMVDALDAIVRATPDDALDDLVAALERIVREGPRQGRFLVFSTSGDEPSLSAVTRHVRLRIDLGSRYPGRGAVGDAVGGAVGGHAVQLASPAVLTAALTATACDPLPTLPEVLRGRRAVVLTNAPEVWHTNQTSDATPMILDALTPEQALTLSDEMRRRLRQEPLVWHGVARIAARYVGRDVHRIPPPLVDSVVVLEADDTYVRAALPGT